MKHSLIPLHSMGKAPECVREFNLEWPVAQRTAKAGVRRQLLAGPKGTDSHHSSTVTRGGKLPTSRPLTK